jgi:hypothetical protein
MMIIPKGSLVRITKTFFDTNNGEIIDKDDLWITLVDCDFEQSTYDKKYDRWFRWYKFGVNSILDAQGLISDILIDNGHFEIIA